jgi:hypothetical protein
MAQPEALFKKALTSAYVKRFPQGWHAYFPATQRRGAPDLYFSLLTHLVTVGVWIEAKVADNPLSAIQKVVHHRMQRAGNRVLVARLVNPTAGLRAQIVELGHSGSECPTRWYRRDIASPAFWDRVATT